MTKAQIYLGAYEGYYNATTGFFESRGGVKPTGNPIYAGYGLFLTNARTVAQLRDSGAGAWQIQDYLTRSAVQLLYLLEYGGFDAQTLLSQGVTNITDDGSTNMAINTGYTSSLGNASGQVTVTHYQTSQTTHACSYRGIENPYGNLCEVVDGINLNGSLVAYVADHGFASTTYSGTYQSTGLTPAGGGTTISDITTSATYDYGFLPLTTGGLSTQHLADFGYLTSGPVVPQISGGWAGLEILFGSDTPSAGMFYFFAPAWWTAGNGYSRDTGMRIMYMG